MYDNDEGVYVREKRKFYYLESGPFIKVGNTVERLRNLLRSRGIIEFDPYDRKFDEKYTVAKVSEAKLKDWSMEPVYLNKHIQTLVESGEVDKPKKASGWKD